MSFLSRVYDSLVVAYRTKSLSEKIFLFVLQMAGYTALSAFLAVVLYILST